MTMETSTGQRAVLEGVPVKMVPTTAREHITGFAALNIPHRWRLGGDWHEAWFDVKPTRVSPHHITDEWRFGRLLDRLGPGGLRDARPGLALLDHPARDWPHKVWAATHERAVIEMAWGAAREDGGQERARRVAADQPPRLLPDPAAPGPVGTGPMVGMAPAEGADADGATGMGPVAERMVAVNCPPIPLPTRTEAGLLAMTSTTRWAAVPG